MRASSVAPVQLAAGGQAAASLLANLHADAPTEPAQASCRSQLDTIGLVTPDWPTDSFKLNGYPAVTAMRLKLHFLHIMWSLSQL